MSTTYDKVRKESGYTTLAEKVLAERSLAKLVSGAIGDGDISEGKALKVYVHGLSTVADYVPGTGVSLTADNSDYVTVNNQKDKAVNEILDGLSLEQAYNDADYVSGRLEAAMEAIAEEMDIDYFKILQADGKEGATTLITSANVKAQILILKLALDKAKAPNNNRYLIVSPEVENAILGASGIILNTPTGDNILYEGYLGNFLGFKVLRTTRLPLNSTGAVQMVAMQARGAVFADGWKKEPALYELNDSTHVGDSKVAARFAYNPGVIRDDLIQFSQLETVKITVDYDSGEKPNDEFYTIKGELVSQPADPVKEGYTFDGWEISSTPVNWGTWKPVSNTTIKATWDAIGD